MVTSPSGGVLALFKEGDASVGEPRDGPWQHPLDELMSTDMSSDKAWLEKTFGYTVDDMPMPDGGTYHVLKNGDVMCAGLMPQPTPNMPSLWVSWG